MSVTSRRGCGPCPGKARVRLGSTRVKTRSAIRNGGPGGGTGVGALPVAVELVLGGWVVEVAAAAWLVAAGFEPLPHPLSASASASDRAAVALAEIDGEEVAVVRREIALRRAVHAGEQIRGRSGPGIAIADEARPVGVDVELHRPDRAGVNHRGGKRVQPLVRPGGVDQVAVTVDADRRAPHERSVAKGRAPLRAVVEVRVGPAVVDDQGQVLTSKDDVRRSVRTAAPPDYVDAAVAVANDRRHPVLKRRVRVSMKREPAAGIRQLEAAVERGHEL